MINTQISSKNRNYTITKLIAGPNRPNANVYLCRDDIGVEYIAKHFYNFRPVANIGYNKKNHYGRRRDGSRRIFDEIKKKSEIHQFLIKHIDRINHKGKWIIIQEYFDGETLYSFIKNNFKTEKSKVLSTINVFARLLKEWHINQFAHGDPHLDNVLVRFNSSNNPEVKLIDYCQLHHPTFHYCKKYNCFDQTVNNRIKEDLFQPSGKLGEGFIKGLQNLESELNINSELTEAFNKAYN